MRTTAFERACHLGLAALALIACGCSQTHEPTGPRLILLLSIDTLRADHLGAYGYARDTSPNLDAFARDDAIVFERAYANAAWTLPAHMSLFTGLYPDAHSMVAGLDSGQLAHEIPTLGQYFRDAGFRTLGLTGGVFVHEKYGFGRGFEAYEHYGFSGGFGKFGQPAQDWLSANADQDCFLFLHTYDVHGPFNCPEPFRSRFDDEPFSYPPRERSLFVPSLSEHTEYLNLFQYETLGDLVNDYDGGIAYVDHHVGELFDHIRALGLWENATILVTSDHGEAFLDNDVFIGHGIYAERETLEIPLLVKLPGSPHAGARVRQPVEQVDVLPTLLASADIAPIGVVHGMDLANGLATGRWQKSHGFGYADNLEFHYLFEGDELFEEAPRKPWDALWEVWSPIPGVGSAFLETDVFGLRDPIHEERRLLDAQGEVVRGAPSARLDQLQERLDETRSDARQSWREPAPRAADRPGYAEQLAALGYTGKIDADLEREIPEAWKAMDRRVEVDWDAFHAADELLWELKRLLHYETPALDDPRVASLRDRATARLEAILRDRPDQAPHARWRLGLLGGARWNK